MPSDFKFISNAGESFTVVSFNATEGISQLYRYDIELKAPQSRAIELDDILNETATFSSLQAGEKFKVHGILASFDEMHAAMGYVYYRAVLVPTLWKLSIYKTNEIYTTEKTIDNIIDSVFQAADPLGDIDYDLTQLNTADLLERDYVCQFAESDFDFISRLIENEGIYYYFDHSGTREKLIFSNGASYPSIARPALIYEHKSTRRNIDQQVNAWICRKQRLPENVSVRDYNAQHPSLDISDTLTVDSLGNGTEYVYGGNLQDGAEASYLTQLRAEEMQCRKTRFYGESPVTRLQAGYTFALLKHHNPEYNDSLFLVTELTREGMNLDTSTPFKGSQAQQPSQYRSTFTAIDAAMQFRPPLVTPKPRFYGSMTAFVYASQGTNNAQIDSEGRYQVHLPFDRADGTKLSNDPDRKASAMIRMAQPFAGENEGLYFPLKGDTEVLLTFINGDPDQPVISAALPNASQPALLNDQNDTEAVIQTLGGNRITLKDNDATESERIVLQSRTENSSIRIGGSDHNVSDELFSLPVGLAETDGIQLRTDKDYTLHIDGQNSQTAGLDNKITSKSGMNKLTALNGNGLYSGPSSDINTYISANADTDEGQTCIYGTAETTIESGADIRIAAHDGIPSIDLQSDKIILDVGSAPNQNVEVNCYKYSVTAAKDSEFKWFNSHKHNYGNSTSTYLGFKQDFTLSGDLKAYVGGSASFNLAAKLDISLGTTTSIFIGNKNSLQLAFNFDAGLAPKASFTKAPNIAAKQSVTAKDNLAQIENIKACLKSLTADISEAGLQIKNGRLYVCARNLKILG